MPTATILPTARTVFLDTNANPLAGGSVYMYVPPNTTTAKTTWQDAGETIPNANPIVLDGNGSCLLYGSGQYLQEVYDSQGNLIYSGLTQDILGLINNLYAVLATDNTFLGTNTFEGETILEGVSVAVTQSAGDTSTKIATDQFVNTTALTLANGTTAITQPPLNNSTDVATTAYADAAATAFFEAGSNQLLSTNGYQVFPGGLIIQWGQGNTTSAPSATTISFPITFPTAVFSITGTAGSSSFAEMAGCILGTTSSFFAYVWEYNSTAINRPFSWIAVGH